MLINESTHSICSDKNQSLGSQKLGCMLKKAKLYISGVRPLCPLDRDVYTL